MKTQRHQAVLDLLEKFEWAQLRRIANDHLIYSVSGRTEADIERRIAELNEAGMGRFQPQKVNPETTSLQVNPHEKLYRVDSGFSDNVVEGSGSATVSPEKPPMPGAIPFQSTTAEA